MNRRICFKEKQSHGRSALPRERTEILHLPVTPTECLSSGGLFFELIWKVPLLLIPHPRSSANAWLNFLARPLSAVQPACLGAGSSLRNCDQLYHGMTPFSCPLLCSCNQLRYEQPASVLRRKQSHARSVLPRERTEITHLPVTPTEWL
jgi:hypothetical protein